MKKLFIIACAVLAVAACEKTNDAMKCGDYEVSVSGGVDTLNVVINGDATVLNRVVSASGARYEGALNDESVVLWSKGENWTLYLNDGEPIECK